MKVLGIVCSPRLHGNTQILMQAALKSAKEAGADVELFTVAGKVMYPCCACDTCIRIGKCRVEDDMKPLYEKMLEADGIIFGSPVYAWSVSAQAKIIMDRSRALYLKKSFRNKVGAILIVTMRAGGTSAFSVLMNYFNLARMACAGGAIGYGKDKGDVRQDQRGMAEAKAVGRVVVRLIKRKTQIVTEDELEKPIGMPVRATPPWSVTQEIVNNSTDGEN